MGINEGRHTATPRFMISMRCSWRARGWSRSARRTARRGAWRAPAWPSCWRAAGPTCRPSTTPRVLAAQRPDLTRSRTGRGEACHDGAHELAAGRTEVKAQAGLRLHAHLARWRTNQNRVPGAAYASTRGSQRTSQPATIGFKESAKSRKCMSESLSASCAANQSHTIGHTFWDPALGECALIGEGLQVDLAPTRALVAISLAHHGYAHVMEHDEVALTWLHQLRS